jgi:6-phosphogluconolactonase (cycloisomerase 2 family)
VNQANIRYQEMILAGRTILGSQFIDGRIDAYRIRDDGTVPGQPTKTTRGNVRTTPVGLAVRNDVLYVATGQWDRVQAYRLNADGVPKDRDPFSETDALKDSFPNAVLLVDVPGACN